MDDLQCQARLIQEFGESNAVKLNASKTEVVKFSALPPPTESIIVAGQSLSTQPAAKCLGVWWQSNLSPAKSVDENILKARRAYFALGSIDAFQGSLNSLSGHSIFSIFILPVLLYRCETWILTEPLLKKLEHFQAELGKRILCLLKHHADDSRLLGLHWSRLRVYIFLRKLALLCKLLLWV